jgi:hypothetical protein
MKIAASRFIHQVNVRLRFVKTRDSIDLRTVGAERTKPPPRIAGTTELKPTQQPASLPTQQFSHSVLKLRNGDQKTAADTKRVFMTRAKFVLVDWFEIPAESMLFGWPKHEVRGNFSAD